MKYRGKHYFVSSWPFQVHENTVVVNITYLESGEKACIPYWIYVMHKNRVNFDSAKFAVEYRNGNVRDLRFRNLKLHKREKHPSVPKPRRRTVGSMLKELL